MSLHPGGQNNTVTEPGCRAHRHRGLAYKLLETVPDKCMIHFIMELISNRSFIQRMSDGQQSRLRCLRNGVPQGSVLTPRLSNIYLYDIPPINAAKYACADDIAIRSSSNKWEVVESNQDQDIATLATYLNNWRLILSQAKSVTSSFHLSNKEASRKLNIKLNGNRFPFKPSPTYL